MTSKSPDVRQITVVIVNYKVAYSLGQALRSLRQVKRYENIEVIVVDNASNDGSREIITSEFPEVLWIQLKQNIGFGKACNVGSKNAHGQWLLFMNPDTIISENAIEVALEFMESRPDVGLVGPKILNTDGSMQSSCRRGFPTPIASFCHMAGLGKLFPKSKICGHYHLTYLDPDTSTQVDAISGSFMFMRRDLFERINGFDERFFMYGEDLDLCWRIKEQNLKVWYHPAMTIIHLKGKSSARRQLRSRIAFYEAMVLFSRKYRHLHRSFFPGWLIMVAIVAQAGMNIAARLFRISFAAFIDLLVINATLWASLTLRFASQSETPYYGATLLGMVGLHALMSGCFLFMFAYNGVYSQKKYSLKTTFSAGIMGFMIFMACVYFISSIAFSRIAFAAGSGVSLMLLIAWRAVLPKIVHSFKRLIYVPDKIIIIGNGPVSARVIATIEEQKNGAVLGIINPGRIETGGEFEGYPLLGVLDNASEILKNSTCDTLIMATDLPWYTSIIEVLATIKNRNITIKWVPREIFQKSPDDLPKIIPLHDFSV